MASQPDEWIPTRKSLLDRLKDLQDVKSWQEFFDIYGKLIYGAARKANLTHAEAEDAVQETMASVAKRMPGFQYDPAIGSFKGWLLKLTRWRVIDQIRKRQPSAVHRSLSERSGTGTIERVIDPAGEVLAQVWDAEWEQNLLTAAQTNVKRRLDPHRHQIYDFYVNKKWPADKVAARFQISVQQVYLAKHRVTELIKAECTRLKKKVI